MRAIDFKSEIISLQVIGKTKAHVTISTDRSATGETTFGPAMVATVRDSADHVIINPTKVHGAKLIGSYEKENAVLPLALEWARATCLTELISIWYESQSLLKAI